MQRKRSKRGYKGCGEKGSFRYVVETHSALPAQHLECRQGQVGGQSDVASHSTR